MKTNEELIGRYVTVESEQGTLIGGVFGGTSQNGNVFLMKEEICLDVDFARYSNNWESLAKPEPWCGAGKIVDDPRKKPDFKPPDKKTSDYWERLSLHDINCE